MSGLYLKSGHFLLAFYRFPFQKTVYRPLIENLDKNGETKEKDRFLRLYARFFSGEPDVLNYAADNYEKKGDKEKALFFYEKSFEWYRFQDFSLIEKIYWLKKGLAGEENAKQFIKKFLSEYYYLRYRYFWPDFQGAIDNFCKKEKVCQL